MLRVVLWDGTGCCGQQLRHLHNSTTARERQRLNHGTLNSKQYRRDQAALLIPLHSQQMSSSPQPPFPEQVSCPPQLSEQSIAQFMLDLPLLDEHRLSPELAACAAKLRSQFTHAASNAQTVLRAVRDAWIAWHSLPIISPGIAFCYSNSIIHNIMSLTHTVCRVECLPTCMFASLLLALFSPICSCGRHLSCCAPQPALGVRHRVHPHHLCRPEHRGRIVHARRFQSPC